MISSWWACAFRALVVYGSTIGLSVQSSSAIAIRHDRRYEELKQRRHRTPISVLRKSEHDCKLNLAITRRSTVLRALIQTAAAAKRIPLGLLKESVRVSQSAAKEGREHR